MSKSPCFWLSTICGSIIFLVLMIILITSFTYVEHDEYAFKKSTISNTVYQDEVYGMGRYLWGVDHTKVSFPAKYQLIDLELDVSNSDGVAVGIDMSFWYKLPKENLSKIYSKYGLNYKSQMISLTNAIVRNTAVQFSVGDFLSHRRIVAETIAKNISQSLAENVYVDVPAYGVELRNVNFPDSIMATHLIAAIRLEENEKKEYEQEATIIRSETDKIVQQIKANTTIILRTAEANKTTKIQSANAKYDEIIGRARGIGIADTIQILTRNDSRINNTVTHTFLKLMAILDNNQTKIVNLESTAIVSL
eukprot:532673_1